MGYGKEIYRQALLEVAERKLLAERQAEEQKNELYDKMPAFLEIDRKMKEAGADAVRSATSLSSAEQIKKLQTLYSELKSERARLLSKAGLNENSLMPRYSCENCGDTGYTNGQLCSCVKEIAKQILYSKLCEQMPLERSTFESFKLSYYPNETDKNGANPHSVMTQIFQFCKQYADRFERRSQSLLFLGATGLGKTHLSLAIAGRAIDKGFGVVYGSAQNFLNTIEREHFGKSADIDTMQALIDCDLLIMDDLGAEFTSPFVISALYNIINTRIQCERPCIFSTNLSLNELESKYSQRIVSRFIGNYAMMRFAGTDIRQQKAIEDLKNK